MIQKLIVLPWAPKQASFKASESVGCAWHVLAISSDAAPYSIPNTASAINSPAFGP